MGFGSAVTTTDLDGDGAAELVIGAYQASPTGWAGEGAVHVVPGTERGTLQVGDVETTRIEGTETYEGLGFTVVGIPPSSATGFGAVAIGSMNGSNGGGSLRIFEGPLTDAILSADSADAALIADEQDDGWCGTAYGYGDFDADGERDHVMGCPRVDGVAGAAYLALGPVSGTIDAYDGTIAGDTVSLNFAYRLAVIGDADGDGADDVAISNPFGPKSASRVFVVSGADFAGFEGAVSDVAAGVFELPNSHTTMALSAGDTDADGYADLFVGALGVVYGILGPVSGAVAEADIRIGIEGEFGIALDAGGDVDGDGSTDLLGGAPLTDHDAAEGYAGGAFLVLGPVSAGSYDVDRSRIRMDGEEALQSVGTSVSHVPDLDGDGGDEVLIGSVAPIVLEGVAPKSAVYMVASEHL